MKNIANMKRLRDFEGFHYAPKRISMIVEGEGFPVAEKLEEYSAWNTMTGHKYSDFTEPLSDDLLNKKVESVEEIKEEFENKALDNLRGFLQKAMMADLAKAADFYKKLEQAPVGFLLKNGKMDEVRSVTADLVDGWINSAIVEKLVGLDPAHGLRRVFGDIEVRVESFTAMIEKLSSFGLQVQEKYKKELNEQDFKRFEENLSILRSEAKLTDLRGHANFNLTGKALYEMHKESFTLEKLLSRLSSGEE